MATTDLKTRAKMIPPRLPDAPTTPVINPLLNLDDGEASLSTLQDLRK